MRKGKTRRFRREKREPIFDLFFFCFLLFSFPKQFDGMK